MRYRARKRTGCAPSIGQLMPDTFEILGARRFDKPVTLAGGDLIVGSFTAQAGPFIISSIRIVQRMDGALRLSFHKTGSVARIICYGPDRHQELIDAAMKFLRERDEFREVRRNARRHSADLPLATASASQDTVDEHTPNA